MTSSRSALRASLLAVVPMVVAACLVPGAALGQEAQSAGGKVTANPSGRKYPPRIYQTVHLVGKPPVIDGRVDDEAWRQGEWAGDYTQNMPTEGAKPSQPTELKILYDDKHVYMAIRAYDDPAKVNRFSGRRDDFNNYAVDIVGVCFDSYNDKRYGFEFDLTAGGAKIDLVLGNGESEWDTTWDAVWDGEVSHDATGWTAEFRIPLSQIRYGPQDEQVWGMHAWRWIARNQEEDQWQLIPRQNTGRMHQLGELRGIRSLPPSHRLEVLPHFVGKVSSGPSVPDGARELSGAAGLDAKVGISSNFTIDVTVDPDFGQVEADPSVMNLTAYETFYEEKRPFFLEGRKILAFEIEEEDQLFYSRRIGEKPSPQALLGESANRLPESTTILGALKVTGKTNGGLSVAALQAVTDRETVTAGLPNGTTVPVEPYGSYTIARVQKDWGKGNTSLGGMMTSTHRWVSDRALAFQPGQASTGGVDFTHYFANRSWVVEANGAFSRVSGDVQAIRALQLNPVHYYQRADATHLGVRETRTSLSGHGGSARVGRSETGRLRLTNHFHWYSPGFDLNEVGYLRQADLAANQVFVGWVESTPSGIFREYSVQLAREDQWDFGGLRTRGSTWLDASAQFANKWRVSGNVGFDQSVDTRVLRGGPALKESDAYEMSLGVSSDSSRRTAVSFYASREKAIEGGSGEWSSRLTFNWRPSNRLLLSANGIYSKITDDLQYVASPETAAGPRWVLGRLAERVWDIRVRANLSVTPDLTVQFYGSPFIATGRYRDFKAATNTLARSYADRFARLDGELTYLSGPNLYQARGGAFTFENPDFSFRQFRSNLVTRWEYKPGSSLYLVWSQGRTGEGTAWDPSFRGNWKQLWRAEADNVFLLKMSYWFSI